MTDPKDNKSNDDPIGRKLAQFVPGPVLVLFSQYIAPFEQDWFVVRKYQATAGAVGAAIGLLLSIALRPILINQSDRNKRLFPVVSLIITMALLLYCYYIWTTLGAIDPEKVQASQNIQTLCFFIAMGFLCLTINLASLASASSKSYTAIILVIVVGAILILAFSIVYAHWHGAH